MRVVKILFGIACFVGALWVLSRPPVIKPDSDVEKLTKLIKQFKGEGYYYNEHSQLPRRERGWGMYDIRKKTHAAIHFGRMGKKAQPAVPLLLKELEQGPNDFDTADGVIKYRSEIARALGEIGDPRAIPILIEKLKVNEPVAVPSYISTGVVQMLAVGVDHEAEIEALGMFGSRAKAAIPVIETFLEVTPQWVSRNQNYTFKITRDIIARYGFNPEDPYQVVSEDMFTLFIMEMPHVSNLVELLDNNKGMESAHAILGPIGVNVYEQSLPEMASYYHVPMLDNRDSHILLTNRAKLAEVYSELFLKRAMRAPSEAVVKEALLKIKGSSATPTTEQGAVKKGVSNPKQDIKKLEYGGFVGVVCERISDGIHDRPISGVRMLLSNEDTIYHREIESDEHGRYAVELPVGRYTVIAFHQKYKTYSTDGRHILIQRANKGTEKIFLTPLSSTNSIVQAETVVLKQDVKDFAFGVYAGTVFDSGARIFRRPIPGVKIRFSDEQNNICRDIESDESGHYSIELPLGRYGVIAFHQDYITHAPSAGDGYFRVLRPITYAGDIYLRPKDKKDLGYSEYSGEVCEIKSNGTRVKPIPGARIRFSDKYNIFHREVESDEFGRYSVELPVGVYNVIAFHPEYKVDSTKDDHTHCYVKKPIPCTMNLYLTRLSSTHGTAQNDSTGNPTVAIPKRDTKNIQWGRYAGVVRENGIYGKPISGARIRFADEHNAFHREIESDEFGRYSAKLRLGRYVVTAFHQGYKTCSIDGGYFVVSSTDTYTGNIFLTPLSSPDATVQAETAVH